MVDKRVLKPFCHGRGEVLQFFLWKRQCGNDLLINGLIHKSLDHVVIHAVTHDILSRKISPQYKRGMCPVQDTDLALLIGLVVVGDQHRKSGLFKGKLCFQGLRPFDHPEAEDFSGIDQLVDIAVLFVDGFGLGAGISCNDPVYQCGTEDVFTLDPGCKILSQIPLLRILEDTLFQLFSIVVDQFAGKDHESFSGFLSECLETAVQKLGQLAGIAVCRGIGKLAGGIIYDSGFSRIACNVS